MQWFVNIYNWIVENLTPIIAWLSTGEIIGIASCIFVMIRNVKTIRRGSFITDRLNDSLRENHKFASACSVTIEDINRRTIYVEGLAKDTLEQLNVLSEDVNKNFDLINSKIGAMMEVQTIVYSTIQDDDLRKSVNNILTSAKYKDIGVQTEIVTEVNKIKEQFDSVLNEMKTKVDTAIQNMNSIDKAVNSIDSPNDVVRY